MYHILSNVYMGLALY